MEESKQNDLNQSFDSDSFKKLKSQVLDKLPNYIKPTTSNDIRKWKNSFLSHKVALETLLYSQEVEAKYQDKVKKEIDNVKIDEGNLQLWKQISVNEIIEELKKHKIIKNEEEHNYKQLLEKQADEIGFNFNQPLFRKIDNLILAEFLNELVKANISPSGKCYGNNISTLHGKNIKQFVLEILKTNANTNIANAFDNCTQDTIKYKALLLSFLKNYDEKYIKDNYDLTKNDLLKYTLALEMQSKIQSHLQPEQQSLQQIFSFQSFNPSEYLANYRLSNEDRKREVANIQSETASRQDRKFDGLSYFRGWEFNTKGIQSLEEQQITANFARSDIIKNLESYEKIASDIEKFKAEYHTDDINVAKIIKMVIQSKDIANISFNQRKITKADKILLTDIANLIFGTEARRNPRALIHSQMILDMVISGELTWKDAFDKRLNQDVYKKPKQGNNWKYLEKQHIPFNGGQFPMSIGDNNEYKEVTFVDNASGLYFDTSPTKGEPVKSSRFLNNLYSGYTKNAYQYEGEKANIINPDDSIKINELVKREGNLVDEYVKPRQWKPLIEKTIEMNRLQAKKAIYEVAAQKNPKAKELLEKTDQKIESLKTKDVLHSTKGILKKNVKSFYGI